MPLRVTIVHNRYRQAGGEDEVFLAESRLLATRGHQVRVFTVDNNAIDEMRPARLAGRTIWNRESYTRLRELLRSERADVVHFHNTFPIISPAAYYAAHADGVAVVQTLHNFRLICPNALLYRDGGVCEDCMAHRVPWPGVLHGCYRGSRLATTATAAMLSVHRAAGTWRNRVARYIALSNFARQKLVQGGIPESRVVVKPNFAGRDPGTGAHDGRFALYVGRLAPEKGLDVLIEACAKATGSLPLKVVGSGPLQDRLHGSAPSVDWVGPLPEGEVLDMMRDAAVLVFPSRVYENCPMTLVQAFATGLPVIASGHGSIAEMVVDGSTGRHVRPGDADDLAEKLAWAAANPDALACMGRRARQEFESKYTAERNYQQLLDIYQAAMRVGAQAA